jgi:hypothetical protein
MNYWHESAPSDDKLTTAYRSLQGVRGWEKDDRQVAKVCKVVSQIVYLISTISYQ